MGCPDLYRVERGHLRRQERIGLRPFAMGPLYRPPTSGLMSWQRLQQGLLLGGDTGIVLYHLRRA
jgi:hypothetical protein